MKRTMPEGRPGRVASWWTHLEVLSYLRVNYRTLKAAMEATPDHIRKPWTNFGSGLRPSYRWKAIWIDQWWEETNSWRVSKNEEMATGSAGGTRMRGYDHDNARTSQQRGKSKRKLKGLDPKVTDGNLVTLVRSLTSTT